MEIKKTGIVTIKEATDEGKMVASFVRYDVHDKDKDVFYKDSLYAEGMVDMAQYNHSNELPVAAGFIKAAGEDMVWEGEFDMTWDVSKAHFNHIKKKGDYQEFSFRAFVEEYTRNDQGGMNIHKARVFEVAPVFVGAGNHTGVVSMKSGEQAEEVVEKQQSNDYLTVQAILA